MRNYTIKVNGKSYFVEVEEGGNAPATNVQPIAAPVAQPRISEIQTTGSKAQIRSPLPGLILNAVLSDGAQVKKGDKVLVLEAMKMEHDINANADGKIRFVVKKGDTVEEGTVLAIID